MEAAAAAWAGAFFFAAVVGFIGDAVPHDSGNFWTGWILQLAGIFAAIAFTGFYPDYATAKALIAAGQPSDRPPSFARIFDWLPTFILVVGIYGWVADLVPDVVGITMIVVGVVGAAPMRKFFPENA